MGEAKRRKALDPNFGKKKKPEVISLEKAKRWCEDSNLLLNPDDSPDYGHWCLLTSGEDEVLLRLEGEFTSCQSAMNSMKGWKLLYCADPDFLVNILLSPKESKSYFEGREKEITSLIVHARPMPEFRQISIVNNISPRIVVPFEIKELLDVTFNGRPTESTHKSLESEIGERFPSHKK